MGVTPDKVGRASDRWENEGGHIAPTVEGESRLATELRRYGIRSSTIAIYEWGGFRYTNASDALAAAKRAES